MSKLEMIKEQFHDLIDRVDDETVLVRHLGEISSEIKGDVTDSWNDLSTEEQAEIMKAYKESEDPANLISHEEAIKRHAPWRVSSAR